MNRSAMPRPTRLPQGSPRRLSIIAGLAVIMLTLGACSKPAPDAPLAGTALGGAFTLVDKAGHPFGSAQLSGKWRVLYFGYTFCPDVCPLDVQHLMQGYHLFARAHPDLAKQLVPMFISIDPARDTPPVVGQFAGAFGPELVGLTGSPAQVAAVAKQYAVFYEKRPGASPGSYLMDHSRAAYLMDARGNPVALLPVDQDGRAVAAELEKWVH